LAGGVIVIPLPTFKIETQMGDGRARNVVSSQLSDACQSDLGLISPIYFP
jgi:hypothetical protein